MKINVDSVSLSSYQNSTFIEEAKIAMESSEMFSYFDAESMFGNDEILPLIAMEDGSLVGDIVRGVYRGTRATVKSGIKGYQAVNKQWGNIKNRWSDLKPKIIKIIKDFGQSLANIWRKFMKYDVIYGKLGEKMQQIIKFTIPSLSEMTPLTINYYDFNVEVLKTFLEYIASYEKFYNDIFSPQMRIIGGNHLDLADPDKTYSTVVKAITDNNVQAMTTICDELSKTIANMNSDGDATIVKAFIRTHRLSSNPDSLLNENARDEHDNTGLSASQYVKMAILGEHVTKNYSGDPKSTSDFKSDMTGHDGYLIKVSSMLNNDVISGALKSSGNSVKKETDKMSKHFDEVIKIAQDKLKEVLDKEAQEKEEAENAKRKAEEEMQKTQNQNDTSNNSDENKDGKDDGTGMPEKPEFQSLSEDSDIKEGAGSLDIENLVDTYIKNMMMLFMKVASTYQMFIKGMLSATYDIISSADYIVSSVERQNKNLKNNMND